MLILIIIIKVVKLERNPYIAVFRPSPSSRIMPDMENIIPAMLNKNPNPSNKKTNDRNPNIPEYLDDFFIGFLENTTVAINVIEPI